MYKYKGPNQTQKKKNRRRTLNFKWSSSVWRADPKMALLNRTYPWRFAQFWDTSKMLIFFYKKWTNLVAGWLDGWVGERRNDWVGGWV